MKGFDKARQLNLLDVMRAKEKRKLEMEMELRRMRALPTYTVDPGTASTSFPMGWGNYNVTTTANTTMPGYTGITVNGMPYLQPNFFDGPPIPATPGLPGWAEMNRMWTAQQKKTEYQNFIRERAFFRKPVSKETDNTTEFAA